MRVGVFGAGSIGCYLGGLLAEAGCEVTLMGRARVRDAVLETGLQLSHYARPTLHPNVQFVTEPDVLADADVILVTTKSQDTEAAGAALAEHIGPGALVISFQNAVGNRGRLRARLNSRGEERLILAGMLPFNVTPTAPGVYHQGTEGAVFIEMDDDPRVSGLADAWRSIGQDVVVHEDILGILWGKVLINLNNPLNALSGGTLRDGLMQRDYRRVLAEMIDEGLAVLKAAKIVPRQSARVSPQRMPRILRLPDWLYRPLMDRIVRIDPHARSSMLDDLDAGKTSENRYIQGEIVRLGEEVDVKTPVNAAVMTAIAEAFEAGRSPGMSGAEMRARFLDGT